MTQPITPEMLLHQLGKRDRTLGHLEAFLENLLEHCSITLEVEGMIKAELERLRNEVGS